MNLLICTSRFTHCVSRPSGEVYRRFLNNLFRKLNTPGKDLTSPGSEPRDAPRRTPCCNPLVPPHASKEDCSAEETTGRISLYNTSSQSSTWDRLRGRACRLRRRRA